MRQVLNKWKLGLYLTAIFFAGSVSGWMIGAKTTKERMFSPPRPGEISAMWHDRLHAKLNFTPEQGQQVDAIIERSAKEIESLRGEWLKAIRQAISNRNTQIVALLNPEQIRQFEEMEAERQEHWRRRDSWPHRNPSERGKREDRAGRHKENREGETNPAPGLPGR